GELILKNIRNTDDVILLDERGSTYSSLEWASHLQKKMNYEGKDIVFVIGGAYGFSKRVYERANGKISLSRMTFSHQIVRVIFLEQLYRAFTIMKGEPYHHE
ncbi:MAG: 23S rRNA (pseudouridine(1915)-N(3))-methyltransferase RlmH, partial [Bacteroidales bacterium]|nr:23S rRNA (pseudouridine(1915)-N(3))-methyltransferase RlmH [Bacteroidales bacterium]